MSMMFPNKPKEEKKEGQSAASKAFNFMMGNKQQPAKPQPVPVQQPKPAPKPVEENVPKKVKYKCKHCGTEYSRDPSKYSLIVCPWCGKKHEE